MNSSTIVDQLSLAERLFTIEMVATKAQLREVFRLRHQVYCIERGFEAGNGDEETDEFDPQSRHVLLRHASDGEVVGTVRLVAHNPTDLSASFPMQRVCEPSLLRQLPLRRTGEISRFAISKQRRLSCEHAALLRLALVRGFVQLSSEMRLTHWFAVMERSLLRLNQQNAIHFNPLGPLVSYHGIRQPAFAAIAALLDRVRREQPSVWHFLTDSGKWFGHQEQFEQAA
jgi:N-acyl-L-homoserine lactone synthetase